MADTYGILIKSLSDHRSAGGFSDPDLTIGVNRMI